MYVPCCPRAPGFDIPGALAHSVSGSYASSLSPQECYNLECPAVLSVLRMVLQTTLKVFRLFYYRFLETKSLLALTQVLQGLAHSLEGNKREFETAFLKG